MASEPLTLSYNQLKTYLVNSYNTITGQVDTRNWTGANSTLDGVIFETNKFMTENPNHAKVKFDNLGNSTADELIKECQELKKDIDGIIVYIENNSNAPDFLDQYNYYIQHFKDRLKMVADRFSA